MDPEKLRKLLKRVTIAGAFFLLALLFYLLAWRAVLIGYAITVGILMILMILLQSGRGGGLASLGGMGGDNLLGARAATPIAKATYVMGALFLFTCMLVSRLGTIQKVADSTPAAQPQQQEEQMEEGTVPQEPDEQSDPDESPDSDTEADN